MSIKIKICRNDIEHSEAKRGVITAKGDIVYQFHVTIRVC